MGSRRAMRRSAKNIRRREHARIGRAGVVHMHARAAFADACLAVVAPREAPPARPPTSPPHRRLPAMLVRGRSPQTRLRRRHVRDRCSGPTCSACSQMTCCSALRRAPQRHRRRHRSRAREHAALEHGSSIEVGLEAPPAAVICMRDESKELYRWHVERIAGSDIDAIVGDLITLLTARGSTCNSPRRLRAFVRFDKQLTP